MLFNHCWEDCISTMSQRQHYVNTVLISQTGKIISQWQHLFPCLIDARTIPVWPGNITQDQTKGTEDNSQTKKKYHILLANWLIKFVLMCFCSDVFTSSSSAGVVGSFYLQVHFSSRSHYQIQHWETEHIRKF